MTLTKKLNINKILKTLITIQLIILPIIDMIRSTELRHIEIFGITIIELINFLLIGFSLLLTIIKIYSKKKKNILILFILLILYILYIIIHYKHIINFDTTIFPMANFSFLIEAFYIVRVYMLPLLLLFVLCENKDIFDKDFYLKIIRIVISVMSFSIIILDLLKLSFISYSPTHDFVTHNFLDYYKYKGNYILLTARGWFDSANELSAILMMLYPINVYNYYLKQNKSNFIILFGQFFAMILLGTKTAALSPVLINMCLIPCYIVISKINKDKINFRYLIKLGLITIICTAFLLISPFMKARIKEMKYDYSIKNQEAYDVINKIDNIDNLTIDELKELDEFMDKNYGEFLINDELIQLYPFNNDREFWIKIAKRNRALNSDSRIMKSNIIKRISERNNNKYDKYLGLGYTLNFIDLERDYVYQYYLFGLVGIILFICPYILILIRYSLYTLKNIKKYLQFNMVISLMSPTIGLIIAYLAGHVFGWVSPMMWLVFIISYLNYNIKINKNIN